MEEFSDNLPPWADQLADIYRSGIATVFAVHGNVLDLAPAHNGNKVDFLTLRDFLADVLFPQRDTVIFYDPSSGISFRSKEARKDFHNVAKASATAAGKTGYDYALPRDPNGAVRAIDTYLRTRVIAAQKPSGVAVVVDYAQTLSPPGEYAHMSAQEMSTLVTLLKWANDPTMMRSDVTICLISENLADLHPALVRNPYVHKVNIKLPDADERHEFITHAFDSDDIEDISELTSEVIADRTAGLSRVNIHQLLSQAIKSDDKITPLYLTEKKKELIERECYGLLEFIEPRFGLDMVSGHDEAKRWIKEDARLLKEGHYQALPMGYLICGPVGTGKSFFVTSATGEIGIPLVKMKNFRSKWVGATEGNLEKILATLRSLGPVGVVVDEADAALGTRSSGGDSGVSSRVFGMIAEQMGDTAYRGKILWFLITARPDLLPIDLKRQGRAEVHIPLFYPDTPDEIADMVRVMAKKNDVPIEDIESIKISSDKKLGGSDIEGVVIRMNRERLLNDAATVDPEELSRAIEKFPSRVLDTEIRMQTLAAVIECTHEEFLPQAFRDKSRSEIIKEIHDLKQTLGEF